MSHSYYHATPAVNTESILANGLRAGTDGFVHLASDPDLAIYSVHTHHHRYTRGLAITIFEVNVKIIQVEPCYDGYTHKGDIPKNKVKFAGIRQVSLHNLKPSLCAQEDKSGISYGD